VKVLSEDGSLMSVYILVCKMSSDVRCVCCSVLKKVAERFVFTHNGVKSVPSYVDCVSSWHEE
jgi:hypothetical protein